MARTPKDWTWKKLAANERGAMRYAVKGWRKPEYYRNARGQIVKATKPKDRRPAVERFFEKIQETPTDCWIYHGAVQFWVTDDVVISPWRFSFEVHRGVRVNRHARFGWTCETPYCCNPEHLYVRNKS